VESTVGAFCCAKTDVGPNHLHWDRRRTDRIVRDVPHLVLPVHPEQSGRPSETKLWRVLGGYEAAPADIDRLTHGLRRFGACSWQPPELSEFEIQFFVCKARRANGGELQLMR